MLSLCLFVFNREVSQKLALTVLLLLALSSAAILKLIVNRIGIFTTHDDDKSVDPRLSLSVYVYVGLSAALLNKNLAIANRSRVSCINTNNNIMTLKSGLEVTQGHWKWHHLIDRLRV